MLTRFCFTLEHRQNFGEAHLLIGGRGSATTSAKLAAQAKVLTVSTRFYALAPHRVVFEFNDPDMRRKVGLSSGPKGLAFLSPSENALPLADLVNIQTDGASLTIRKRPALLGGGSKGKARYIALLPAPPASNEKLAAAGPQRRFQSGTVNAEEFDLKIERPFTLITNQN